MNFQDLRRIVEERATGNYYWKKKTDSYEEHYGNEDQYKELRAMLRSEILKRFKSFHTKKPARIVVQISHNIHETDPRNPGQDYGYYYHSSYDKVRIPKGADREIFKLDAEITMADGVSRWNCTRHKLFLYLIRHSKNMNWQTNRVTCSTSAAGSYKEKTSAAMLFIARELEGLFGVSVSLVEKQYKSSKEKFKEASK